MWVSASLASLAAAALRSAVRAEAAFLYSAAVWSTSSRRVFRISSRSTTSESLAETSWPKAMTSATVWPYLRFRRSSRARRSSISDNLSGEALMPSA